ncbi:MAG: dynamin family protein [Candidatus Riflebacteria bacterium]|nr:dynamin family protein [Candidatus Riflebacteria bacterium]
MMKFEKFTEYKKSLFAFFGQLSDLISEAGFDFLFSELKSIEDKLKEEKFYISVVGEIKRGKSSLINAIIGREILPKAAVICTAVLTILRYGENPSARIVFRDNSEKSASVETLNLILTKKNSKSEEIAFVEIFYPLEILSHGVVIVDTPGVNDTNEFRRKITEEFIPSSDGILFVLNAGQPLSESERKFLSDEIISANIRKVWLVLNAIDRIPCNQDRDKAVKFCAENISEMIPNARIFPVSSKLALQGSSESGFSEFISVLSSELISSRRQFLFEIPYQKTLSLIEKFKVALNFSLKKLTEEKEASIIENSVFLEKMNDQKKRCRQAIDRFAHNVETIVYDHSEFPPYKGKNLEDRLFAILKSDQDNNQKKDEIDGLLRSRIQSLFSKILSEINCQTMALADNTRSELFEIIYSDDSLPSEGKISLKIPDMPFLPETDHQIGGKSIISNFGRMASLVFLFHGNLALAAISLIAGIFTTISEKDFESISREMENQYSSVSTNLKNELLSRKTEIANSYKHELEKQLSDHFKFLENLLAESSNKQNQSQSQISEKETKLQNIASNLAKLSPQKPPL